MYKCKGFTLLELMTTTSILAVLSAVVVPNFTSFITKIRADSEVSQLHRLLLTARNSAINSGQAVTVCPLNKSNECSDTWQGEISVFIDTNNNNKFDANLNEVIIRVKEAIGKSAKLQYGKRRNRVIFSATGRTTGWGSNGTFKYCPNDYNELSRAIVVSTSGRFYLSFDIDNDGIEETRNGNKIICR